MGKSSRQKRRTYQTPKRSRNGANLVWYAMAGILVVAGALGIVVSRSKSTASGAAPTAKDHWHIALGVNDCGTWVPNWPWPPGATSAALGSGPAQAGSGGALYAPLHSHDDGLIHIEPQTDSQGGNNATLGSYFKYGGWKLNDTSIKFVNVDEKNGNTCSGKPGVLRWAVNGKEKHGDPAKYKLAQGDVIELVFTTAGAKIPPVTDVPSYADLQQQLGNTPTSAPAANAPTTTAAGSTTTAAPTGSTSSSTRASTTSPTTVGNTTTPTS